MPGFYTKTAAGHTVHVNGDPNMSEEARSALTQAMDVLIAQYAVEIKAFEQTWDQVGDDATDKDKASWWFNEGVEYQKAQSKKRIEYLERRLSEEIEAHKPK